MALWVTFAATPPPPAPPGVAAANGCGTGFFPAAGRTPGGRMWPTSHLSIAGSRQIHLIRAGRTLGESQRTAADRPG